MSAQAPSRYRGRRNNGYVLTGIVAAHVVALTAVALSKMDLPIPNVFKPQIVRNIPLDPVPPPPPAPRERVTTKDMPTEVSVVTTVRTLVPTPTDNPISNPTPIQTPYIGTGLPSGNITVLPPTVPLIDPVVPAPTMVPVKLKPRGDPASWVTTDDYPAAALRSEEQGRTGFRLTVGFDGKPTACVVSASSGSSTLDAAACRLLMRRAKFKPGSDARGEAVGGVYANSFLWTIPE